MDSTLEDVVDVGEGLHRAHATKGGEDPRVEDAVLRNGAGEVLAVLLGGSRREDGGGVHGGVVEVLVQCRITS